MNSESRSAMAVAKSFFAMASETLFVTLTASTKEVLSILFSRIVMIGEGEPGLASRTALTASMPWSVASHRS